MKNKLCSLCAAFAGELTAFAYSQEIPSVKKIELRAQQCDTLNVVFFGGSLTWGANASDPNRTSWRGQTMKMLREKYPLAQWHFFDAAIGGTGSSIGVFRLERDVLKHKPDLVILEFSMNDNVEGLPNGLHDCHNQSYEAILRHCLSRGIVVLPVILTFKNQVLLPSEESLNRLRQHREIFAAYQLEYADVMARLRQAYQAGKLDPETCWPAGLFDNIHPHDAGYLAFAEAFQLEWERICAAPARPPQIPDKWVCGETYRHISRLEARELPLPNGWVIDFPLWQADTFDWLSSRWMDRVAYAGNAIYKGYGNYEMAPREIAPLELKFKGECVVAFLDLSPQSAELELFIDGQKLHSRSWLPQIARVNIRYLAENLDSNVVHTLRLRLVSETGRPGVIRLGGLGFAGRNNAGLVVPDKHSQSMDD